MNPDDFRRFNRMAADYGSKKRVANSRRIAAKLDRDERAGRLGRMGRYLRGLIREELAYASIARP